MTDYSNAVTCINTFPIRPLPSSWKFFQQRTSFLQIKIKKAKAQGKIDSQLPLFCHLPKSLWLKMSLASSTPSLFTSRHPVLPVLSLIHFPESYLFSMLSASIPHSGLCCFTPASLKLPSNRTLMLSLLMTPID